jgi:hypothetical protein
MPSIKLIKVVKRREARVLPEDDKSFPVVPP